MERSLHSVTADMVVLREGPITQVLLIRRGKPPFEGHWALPGGFVETGERTKDAAIRELQEETGLEVKSAGLVGIFDDPKRDPRGPNIGTAYWVLVPGHVGDAVRGADDAAEAAWVSLAALDEIPLAFDHKIIISRAVSLYRYGV